MSTQETRASPLRYARGHRRKPASLSVDLNLNLGPPSIGNQEPEGGTSSLPIVQGSTSNSIPPPTPIDVEALDDEVLISSPRAFAEAKTRRNRGRAIVVDDDPEDPSSCVITNPRTKRRRASQNQTIINCDLYINLEGSGSSSSVRDNVKCVAPPPPPPPPPVKEPTFNCPVCMSPFVEAVSTKCGHIFCKGCIKAAIAVQNKCPTCRKKITIRELIRVYLPTAS